LTAGLCSTADGNNNGLCVSITCATCVTGASAYSTDALALTTAGATVANCLAQSATNALCV
jgi:hypothetical protein